MKRDKDLVLKILRTLEESDLPALGIYSFTDGVSEADAKYHLRLCVSAGYIEVTNSMGGPGRLYGLTMAGHDFIDERAVMDSIMTKVGQAREDDLLRQWEKNA